MRKSLIITLLGLTVPGCGTSDQAGADEGAGDESDTSSSDESSSESTGDETAGTDESGGGDPTYSVSGTVQRAIAITANEDGIGDLDVGLFTKACAPGLGQEDEAAFVRMMDLDLNDAGTVVPFELAPAVPAGTYWISAVFDDNQNLAETPGHAADSGDLVPTACPMLVVEDDVEDVEIVLDFAIP